LVPVKNRPVGWFFPGWFSFCLYGPFVSEHLRITIFEKGGNVKDNLKINGRAASRENEDNAAAVFRNNVTRNNVVRNSVNKSERDMSMSMKLGLANLKQQNKDSKVVALTCRLQTAQKNIERADQRAQRCCPEYDETNLLWKKVDDLEKEAKVLEKKLDDLINDDETSNVEGGTDMINKFVIVDGDSNTPKRSRLSSEDYTNLNITNSSNSSK
jgi:hypothetical protein